MLRNRSFLVKPIQDADMALTPVVVGDPSKLVEAITKGAVIVIAAYMGGDTLRRVLVHVAKTGIQAE